MHLALYPLLLLSGVVALGAILVAVAKDGPALPCVSAYLAALAVAFWSAWMLGLIDLQVSAL
ncbi:hypothetical protein ACLBYG_22270 [Methylobacterium sp. D53M]